MEQTVLNVSFHSLNSNIIKIAVDVSNNITKKVVFNRYDEKNMSQISKPLFLRSQLYLCKMFTTT